MKAYAINLCIVLAAVFAPAKGMLISALCLIAVDLITGIMAAKKQGTPVTSAGLRRTVSKLLVYEIAIALAYIAQHYLMNDMVPAASIVSGFVGITELTSCYENMNTIGGNDLLKKVIDKLGSSNQ